MEKYINSANVEKISWSNDTLRVYINNGQVVAYKNIPEGIAAGMAQAPSEGYELLRIKIYHKSLTTTTTDISSTLCEHLVETYSTLK